MKQLNTLDVKLGDYMPGSLWSKSMLNTSPTIFVTPKRMTLHAVVNNDKYPLMITSFDISEMRFIQTNTDAFKKYGMCASQVLAADELTLTCATVSADTELSHASVELIIAHTPANIVFDPEFEWYDETQLRTSADLLEADIDVKASGNMFETTRGWHYSLELTQDTPLVDPDNRPSLVDTLVVKRTPDMSNVDYSEYTDKVIEFNTSEEPWLNTIQTTKTTLEPIARFTLYINGVLPNTTEDELLALDNLEFIIRTMAATHAITFTDTEHQTDMLDDVDYIGAIKLVGNHGKMAVFTVGKMYINVYLPNDND